MNNRVRNFLDGAATVFVVWPEEVPRPKTGSRILVCYARSKPSKQRTVGALAKAWQRVNRHVETACWVMSEELPEDERKRIVTILNRSDERSEAESDIE